MHEPANITEQGESALANRPVEAVVAYRWSVEPAREAEFFAALRRRAQAIVAWGRGRDTPLPLSCRILQPVIGPGLRVWELHVDLPSLTEVGNLWATLTAPGDASARENEAFRSLAGLPGGELLENGSPLFRVWVHKNQAEA